jgi:preprotein translocase subunit YajC
MNFNEIYNTVLQEGYIEDFEEARGATNRANNYQQALQNSFLSRRSSAEEIKTRLESIFGKGNVNYETQSGHIGVKDPRGASFDIYLGSEKSASSVIGQLEEFTNKIKSSLSDIVELVRANRRVDKAVGSGETGYEHQSAATAARKRYYRSYVKDNLKAGDEVYFENNVYNEGTPGTVLKIKDDNAIVITKEGKRTTVPISRIALAKDIPGYKYGEFDPSFKF